MKPALARRPRRTDVSLREQEAAEKLDWVRVQLDAIRPTVCILFASYVVFAHEENHYLNDRRNTVQQACKVIDEAGVRPVVLYPGDIWNVGEPHDPQRAIDLYERPGTRPRGSRCGRSRWPGTSLSTSPPAASSAWRNATTGHCYARRRWPALERR